MAPLGIEHLLLGVLVAIATSASGSAVLVARSRRQELAVARARTLDPGAGSQPDAERELTGLLGRLGELASAGRLSKGLRRELSLAGYHGVHAATVFFGTKVLLLAVGLSGFGALALLSPLTSRAAVFLVLCGAAVLFFLPNLVVTVKRRERTAEVKRHLPDAVDLLEICVSSGMGLDMAWNAVALESRSVSPILADEMELTNIEIGLGVPRAVAMKNMAARTGVADISSLVALLVQSDRFGASIVDAFHTFAHSLREIRTREAEESAEKMAVKMLFPMVLFIFPVLLIVMVGPAVMSIMDNMG